ncbi:MAG: hypothetical protein EXQ96_02460 [Alphaproteobacteria bacterium]|nr:hypothetical protein [Alphaproteobacteria bacterium]
MTRTGRTLLALLVALAAGGPVAAATSEEASIVRDLELTVRALEDEQARGAELNAAAEGLAREANTVRANLIAAARRVQVFETRLTEVETTVAWLERLREEKQAEFARRRVATGEVLAGLIALGRRPVETMIGRPGDLRSAFHGHLLLAAAVPALQARAREIDDELGAIESIEQQLFASRTELAALLRSFGAEEQALALLLDRKGAEYAATWAERDRAQAQITRLVAEARSLHELLESVVQARQHAGVAGLRPAPRSFTAARGSLALPAEGRLVVRFGDSLPDGTQSRGVVVETRAAAQVVTPFDGEVVFAGDFRGLGRLLIIAHGEGYHTLLAGFSRIDSVLGQWLLAGEPVGTVGPSPGRSARLHIELRRNGIPVNPVPWLAAGDSRISG